jgi:hypothetical protein
MTVHTSKGLDYVSDWLWMIADEIVPPFCVELVLKDGNTFSLHSISSKDEQTRSMVIRIWDLRSFTDQDLEELRGNLNQVQSRNDLADEQKIHPKLDWANLRINVSDISYCVEWHDRMWPEDIRPKIGFDLTNG